MTSDHGQDTGTQGGASLLTTYLERRSDLVRFFTTRLRSPTAAEDLVQDIYLRVSGLDPATEAPNPVGYLYKLGSNLMLDRMRGERRTAAREASWRDSHRTVIGSEEVDETPSPEQALTASQMFKAALAALEALPPP